MSHVFVNSVVGALVSILPQCLCHCQPEPLCDACLETAGNLIMKSNDLKCKQMKRLWMLWDFSSTVFIHIFISCLPLCLHTAQTSNPNLQSHLHDYVWIFIFFISVGLHKNTDFQIFWWKGYRLMVSTSHFHTHSQQLFIGYEWSTAHKQAMLWTDNLIAQHWTLYLMLFSLIPFPGSDLASVTFS